MLKANYFKNYFKFNKSSKNFKIIVKIKKYIIYIINSIKKYIKYSIKYLIDYLK